MIEELIETKSAFENVISVIKREIQSISLFNGNYQVNLKNTNSFLKKHSEFKDSLKSNNNYRNFVFRIAKKNLSTYEQLIKISEKLLKVSLELEVNNKKMQISVNIILK